MDKVLSIIIPCYNVEKYIERCIETLVNQTIGINNLELIFVNDASTDQTLDILLIYEKKYAESIIVINNVQNMGIGGARNVGLQYASGDYIGFVDSDDWIEFDMYQKLYSKALKFNSDVVCCRFIRDDGNNNEIELIKQNSTNEDVLIKIENLEERNDFIASNIIGVYVWNKIYKREIIYSNNIIFPENLAYEDVHWGAMFYLYIDTVYILEEELYHYFVNPQSTVLNKNKQYHLDLLKVNYLKWEEYRKRGVLDKYRQALEYDFLNSYYFAGLKMLFLRYDEVQYNIFLEIKKVIKELIPNYRQNKYIDKYTPDIYIILLELLDKDISREELELLALYFRRISSVNK